MEAIALGWAGLIHKIQKALSLRLQQAGLSGVIVGCSEIQPERSEREGRPVLHLHLVWVGRLARGGWAVSTSAIDAIWGTLLSNVIGRQVSVGSACQLKAVKKTASSYLGKYLSKGNEQADYWANSWYCDWIPNSWWFASLSLRRACESLCLRGVEVGGMLRWLLDIGSGDVERRFEVTIGVDKIPVGWGGKISKAGVDEIYQAFHRDPPSMLIEQLELK
jgi:hypothetical protein